MIVRPRTPRFEGDTGDEAPTAASGGVGTTPMEHVDVEEVEEEDPDVHFKRKREGGSRRKRVVKKPRRSLSPLLQWVNQP